MAGSDISYINGALDRLLNELDTWRDAVLAAHQLEIFSPHMPEHDEVNERRIARLQELIKARAAEVVAHELADPELGMVTITRVQLDREMMMCRIYWSCLGGERDKERNAEVLGRARKFVRREIGAVLSTRTVPDVQFRFDESIAGAQRVDRILKQLREEREGQGLDDADADGDAPPRTPDAED